MGSNKKQVVAYKKTKKLRKKSPPMTNSQNKYYFPHLSGMSPFLFLGYLTHILKLIFSGLREDLKH